METPFLPEHGLEWTKLVVPSTLLPEELKFVGDDPDTFFDCLGKIAVYLPDWDIGFAYLPKPRSLRTWRKREALKPLGKLEDAVGALLIIHTAWVFSLAANVRKDDICPSRRGKTPLAPILGNTYRVINLRGNPIRSAAQLADYVDWAMHPARRLHLVRAHFRYYKSGLITLVRAHTRGRDTGEVDKHFTIGAPA
jgi:hypothetical protein